MIIHHSQEYHTHLSCILYIDSHIIQRFVSFACKAPHICHCSKCGHQVVYIAKMTQPH